VRESHEEAPQEFYRPRLDVKLKTRPYRGL
jgi:hypothetical protein